MAKEENITIRCSEATKTLFNTIASENPQFSKGDLFELMIKSYIALQQINKNTINEINKYVRLNYEYLCLFAKCNASIPSHVMEITHVINTKPQCDKYIRNKICKEK